MKRLNIYICENYASDYRQIAAREGYEEVDVCSFPCWCIRPQVPEDFIRSQKDACEGQDLDCMIICGRQCPLLKAEIPMEAYRIVSFDYCQECLLSNSMAQFIISRGGYLLSSGWLQDWRERLREAGFDRELARRFYSQSCQELVLLDSGFDSEAALQMEALSQYLDCPYRIISIGTDYAAVLLRSLVHQWRAERQKGDYEGIIARLRQESAEYAAVLNIIERITVTHDKRAIISKLMEVCTMLFGGQKMRYYDHTDSKPSFPPEVQELAGNMNMSHILVTASHDVFIKINHQEEVYGVLLIGDLIFPQYLERYLQFALSVAKIGGLALSNAAKMEALERSRDEMAYASYHDALTGLYNRAYFNRALENQEQITRPGVFICDVDGLKHVNDTYGHGEGDGLIARAAQVLGYCFRETDLLARIGGDEFAAIVMDCDDAAAGVIRERIQQAIQESNQQNPGRPYELSISVGWALQAFPGERLEKLVHNADEAMYDDKLRKKRQKK